MAKVRRENPRHLTRITMHMEDTINMKLLPAIRPTCHHQNIRHSKSLREELAYVAMKARGDKVMTLAVETSHHRGMLAVMADSSKGNNLDMTVCNIAATMIKIVLHAAAMTNVAYLCFICASPGSTASMHSYKMKYQEYKGLYYNA
jgi:hypothetical protein